MAEGRDNKPVQVVRLPSLDGGIDPDTGNFRTGLHTPGILVWARQVYKDGNERVAMDVLGGYNGLLYSEVVGLLDGSIETWLEDDGRTVCFYRESELEE